MAKIRIDENYIFVPQNKLFKATSFVVYLLVYTILQIVAIVFFTWRIKKPKHIKKLLKTQGCITVSNHCHYLDAPYASMSIFPQMAYITMMQGNAEIPVISALLKLLRAFPIPASPNGIKRIQEPIKRLLEQKKHVHFLAEGHLKHLSQKVQTLKLGSFHQAYLQKVPLVPMAIVLKRRKIGPWLLPRDFVKMTVVFGDALTPPPFDEKNFYPKEELTAMAEKTRSWMQQTIDAHHGKPQ